MNLKLEESDARTSSKEASNAAISTSVLGDSDDEVQLVATPTSSVRHSRDSPLHHSTTLTIAINMADRFPSLEDFSEGTASIVLALVNLWAFN